ncbi:MAG: hypothetical protein ACRD2T_13545 [Thermoanaerobaculia bacterium]
MNLTRILPPCLLAAAMAAGLVLAASRDEGPEPVEISPRPAAPGGPGRIVAGEVHLLVLLQSLADLSRMPVVYAGGPGFRDEKVAIEKPLDSPDRGSVALALAASGYAASEESYRGRKVVWVSRELRPTRKKGAILRVGERPADGGKAEPSAPSAETAAAAGEGEVRVFARGDGGAGTTYLVLFETASKREAEDARALILSLVESRRSKGARGEDPKGEKAAGSRGRSR